MDIVIISEFGEDYSSTDNDRFLYLAKMLQSEGDCNVEIITSSFRHTTKTHRNNTVTEWPFQITFIDEPGYKKNVCLKRFYSHYIWGKNLVKYLNKRKTPDVIYCAIPSISGPNKVSKFCKKNKIKFIIDVQDLWPEAFKMIIRIPLLSDILFYPFTMLSNGIYKRADVICGVSDTYCRRAIKNNKRLNNTTTVFLGTDLSIFDKYSDYLNKVKKERNEIWIAYCGTLGSSYDLTCVIDAISLLNNKNIKFIVMGDGPLKTKFELYAKEKKISSEFTGRLKYNEMCKLLVNCDITVNPITHMAAQSIINKHADYAASGKPVVSTQECEEYRNLIDNYKMGFNCNNNDSKDLSEKIQLLVSNEELRITMGKNARKCAEEKFDRAYSYKALISEILNKFGDKKNEII